MINKIATAAATALAMSACAPPSSSTEPHGGTSQGLSATGFDAMGDAIAAALAPIAVGYGYAIYDGTTLVKSDAGGKGRIEDSVNMSENWRFGVMSTSKTITAAAVMHRIEAMQADDPESISIDSTIGQFLPTHWDLGSGVATATLAQVLRHRAGLVSVNGDACSWDELKQTAANDVSMPDDYRYDNANFCLLRIILPYMISKPSANIVGDDGALHNWTKKRYRDYTVAHVLEPSGVSGAQLKDTSDPKMRFYDFDDTSKQTEDASDDTGLDNAGAGYWNLSVVEYGRFISSLAAGQIISAENVALMQDSRLGMFGVTQGTWGTYYGHRGAWANGDGAGAQTQWLLFPRCKDDTSRGWISAFAMVNSRKSVNDVNLSAALQSAYGNAVSDSDGDGIADDCDACPLDATSAAKNVNSDGDALCDATDLCPLVANTVNQDKDGDGLCDDFDTCPDQANPDNLDTDGDGDGDVCDENDDNDACPDDIDLRPTHASMRVGVQINLNCNPSSSDHFESESGDNDADGILDCADPNDDNDDFDDEDDPCPWVKDSHVCVYKGADCPVSPLFELCKAGPCGDFLIRVVAAINPDPTRAVVLNIASVRDGLVILEEERDRSSADIVAELLDARGLQQECGAALRMEVIDTAGRGLADLATYVPELVRVGDTTGRQVTLQLPTVEAPLAIGSE